LERPRREPRSSRLASILNRGKRARSFSKDVRCRAGTLRGRRSLRDLYTGFALGLPDGRRGDSLLATNGSLDPKGITHHEVIAARAGSPAGRPSWLATKNSLRVEDQPALERVGKQPREPLLLAVLLLIDTLVPKGGLEPPHPCEYMDLNHARLPIPPLRRGEDLSSRRPEHANRVLSLTNPAAAVNSTQVTRHFQQKSI
jgi:hypothetical protein